MKKSLLKKFYESYNINMEDKDFISFLKKENIYKEEFLNIQLKEIKDYINKRNNITKTTISKKENKEKHIYTLKKITDKAEVINFIKKEMKKQVKIKEENLEKIRNNFNYKVNPINNFSRINIKELFDFGNIICRTAYKNERYRLFVKIDYVIIYMSVFDVIDILFSKRYFKNQVEFLYELFNYDEFDNKVRDKIIKKEKLNKKFLKEQNNKILNKHIKTIEYLMAYERNTFDPKNRDKDGNFYFFMPRNKLAEDLGISATKAQDTLKILLFLNIIKIVPYENINEIDENRINQNNKYKNVNLYRISFFTKEEKLILENLELYKKNKITGKKLTEKFLKEHFPNKVKSVFNSKVIREEISQEEFIKLLEEDIKLFEEINL